MTLREARVEFSRCVGKLLAFPLPPGTDIALGEGADFLTAKDQGTDHLRTGLHSLGLAQDIVLYRDGVYLTATEDYRSLGEFWETLHPFCHWGGSFGDGNHFSFSDSTIPGCVAVSGRLKR